jgi:hypothetical protein
LAVAVDPHGDKAGSGSSRRVTDGALAIARLVIPLGLPTGRIAG